MQQLFTTFDLAHQLNLSVGTIVAMAEKGYIPVPYFTSKGSRLFDDSALAAAKQSLLNLFPCWHVKLVIHVTFVTHCHFPG